MLREIIVNESMVSLKALLDSELDEKMDLADELAGDIEELRDILCRIEDARGALSNYVDDHKEVKP